MCVCCEEHVGWMHLESSLVGAESWCLLAWCWYAEDVRLDSMFSLVHRAGGVQRM